MATYYFYAPICGLITALRHYCDGGDHPDILHYWPIDISNGFGTVNDPLQSLLFEASSNVLSIKTTRHLGIVCAPPSPGAPWADGVEVELYNTLNATQISSTQGKVGSVFYAHVDDPIPNGIYNTNSTTIGWVPPFCYVAPGILCGCYQGTHSHIEASTNASTNPALGWQFDSGCLDGVGAGTTWIYRWDL